MWCLSSEREERMDCTFSCVSAGVSVVVGVKAERMEGDIRG